jgi:hypothetical protein
MAEDSPPAARPVRLINFAFDSIIGTRPLGRTGWINREAMEMGDAGGCCGGNQFADLEPGSQAEFLAALAQEARLLEFSLEGEDTESRTIGARLQRALESALDADGPDEVRDARDGLEEALAGARAAGLRLSAQLGEVDVDGILGTMKMRVLSTVLAPPPPAPALNA